MIAMQPHPHPDPPLEGWSSNTLNTGGMGEKGASILICIIITMLLDSCFRRNDGEISKADLVCLLLHAGENTRLPPHPRMASSTLMNILTC